MHFLEKLTLFLHLLIERICLLLISGLVFSQLTVVLLRYIYGIGFLKLQDFSLYCFSALVALSVVYTFARNAHVRVDVFRERQTVKIQCAVDTGAVILLLLPVFGLTVYWLWPDILYAWQIKEGSKETGGLPGLFVIKTTALILSLAMLIQGVAIVMRGGRFISLGGEK